MKKFILPFLLFALLFSSCGEKASENSGDAQMNAPGQNVQRVSSYDSDGISFDVPEMWQNNFKAVTRNVGSTDNTYPQTEFYYTKNGREVRLMSIGKFTRDQWEKMKKDGAVSDDATIGESADKKHVYSIFYEDHDYIKDDDELKETLTKLKDEATKIRDKIMIK